MMYPQDTDDCPVTSIVTKYDDGEYAVPYREDESISDTNERYGEGHDWMWSTTDYSAALYPDDPR